MYKYTHQARQVSTNSNVSAPQTKWTYRGKYNDLHLGLKCQHKINVMQHTIFCMSQTYTHMHI